ncbi:hypothetical protein [Streptomyces sp. UNOB3_S3]|uniref:hypothetical protein n=1 Tax=Streptomyces sp. UNOB3_S3 TaxID=2871682 RepID=UPI001E46814E|nr:hypothetical protein [Streptomyces sp. UNOB3_S3]MCC3775171.1 hypothetical protein [Streptomyces sp. UNOB3_S3]
MTQTFKAGDKVVITGVPGQGAASLFHGKVGIVHAIHTAAPYPNEVKFPSSGLMCFADHEMAHAEENPGRRHLAESPGFPHGIDTAAAQSVMRYAVTGQEQRESIDIDATIEHLENIKQYIEVRIRRLREAA